MDRPLLRGVPYVWHSATSAQAATSIDGPRLGAMQSLVLAYIEEHGPVTDQEIADGLSMCGSSARPRRIELARDGLIEQAGTKPTRSRRNAAAWVRLASRPPADT